MASAAAFGGWWLAGPLAFFVLADRFNDFFGLEERNMDPDRTRESQLFFYKLSMWLWAATWPATFVFVLWQMLVAGHLSGWEIALMTSVLAGVSQTVFIVGHEMVHRRAAWERRLGEFLLAGLSYPHYATEHVYIHHPHVCTPGDPGSAPKGLSFWGYLPRELASNIVGSWRFERDRLARRHLPVWHYTNPFWRYVVETALWYALIYWMGGVWAVLVYAILCFGVIVSMKIGNYVQHYGLRRVRLPGGRFETVKPRHVWSAAYKFTNWLYYNMQRHADHHAATNRRYPVLQHHGENLSPRLPGSYVQMNGLALFPSRWFTTMDPLLDRQRARFYPQMKDWSAYDSPAFAARPNAFEAITDIHGSAPRLAGWINQFPELLDSLRDREFTDLDLPDGFGPDPEFEAIARRGLARVYWTLELGVAEMKEELGDIPVQDGREAVDAALEWSNRKVFQLGVHVMRGSLSPIEAGVVLSNVAEAAIATVLAAMEEDFADSGGEPPSGGGVAVVLLGAWASREVVAGTELDVMLAYDGGPAEYYEALCRRFRDALRALSCDNLLIAPIPRGWKGGVVRSLDEFAKHYGTAGSAAEVLELTRARCVFVSGDPEVAARFEAARQAVLSEASARNVEIAELRETNATAVAPGFQSIDEMRGGFRDLERAEMVLRLRHAGDAPDLLLADTVSVFRSAGGRGIIPGAAAERLAQAATLWRNLRGSFGLITGDSLVVESTAPKVKSVIARASGMDEFDALPATIRDTASRAAADIEALAESGEGHRP